VAGLPDGESAALLAELNALVRVPEYQCRFRWATRRDHPALAMGGKIIFMRLCINFIHQYFSILKFSTEQRVGA
jgi:hypothetical protein